MPTTTAGPTRLHDRLRRETAAEVRFDAADRWLYATDASLYQVEPAGVASHVEPTYGVVEEMPC